MPTTPTETKNLHFPHLDALRGLAAFGVLIFHIAFSSALSPVWLRAVPAVVNDWGHLLANGVEVFFVLSGWVIAHSMRRDPLQFFSLGRFLLRRTIRLSFPYWAALLLALILAAIGMRLGSGDSFPSATKITLNFFYLQNFFGVGNVFSPAWTLCIEAQFYVAFVAILGIATYGQARAEGEEPFGAARNRLATLLFGSVLATLALTCCWNNSALFVSWWFYFAGGALGYLASRDSRLMPLAVVATTAMAGVALWLYWHPVRFADEWHAVIVGAVTLLFLSLAHGRTRWTQWGRAPLLAWLGRISYSLYLTHFGFGLLLARVLRQMAHPNAPMALGLVVLDMALCLLLAQLFWQWVERPSIEWSNTLKLKSDAFRESFGVTPWPRPETP